MENKVKILLLNEGKEDIAFLTNLLEKLRLKVILVNSIPDAIAELYRSYISLSLIIISKSHQSLDFLLPFKLENKVFIPTIAINIDCEITVKELYDFGFEDVFRAPFDEHLFKLRLNSYLKLKRMNDKINNEKLKLEKEIEFSMQILKSINLGILLFDDEGKILFENENAILCIGNSINENINHLLKSDRFITGKSAYIDFLNEDYQDSLYLTTKDGKYLEIKRMSLIENAKLTQGAVIINELNTSSKVMKADHKTLKSFLKYF